MASGAPSIPKITSTSFGLLNPTIVGFCRAIIVPAEDRTVLVPSEARLVVVDSEDRSLVITAENRTLIVPCEAGDDIPVFENVFSAAFSEEFN